MVGGKLWDAKFLDMGYEVPYFGTRGDWIWDINFFLSTELCTVLIAPFELW